MTPARELELIYVFACGTTPELAHDLVLCYDNEQEIIETLEIYKTAVSGGLVPARD